MVLILLLVSGIIFTIVNLLPGDVAIAILGDGATPDQIEAMRKQLGLDLPASVRYWNWLSGMLQGDFGMSLEFHRPIAPLILARLKNSMVLAFLALVIAVPLAIAMGVVSAAYRGSIVDRVISAISTFAVSLPEYVVGLAFILVFGIWLAVLPGSSLLDPSMNPLSRPSALVLPVAVLTVGMLAHLSQITRASMIEALESPYVRTAVLKGLPYRVVVLKHALRNAMLPAVAEIGMNFGYMLGGLVIVESLFSYSGIGQLLVSAIDRRDVPLIQATVLVVAVGYGIGNLLADIVSIFLNPRLRD